MSLLFEGITKNQICKLCAYLELEVGDLIKYESADEQNRVIIYAGMW